MATQTVQHGKSAQKARFDNLPSGGTPREEAAFSHGVAPSVIVVDAKRDITYTSEVGRQARPVDPLLASHSCIDDQLRHGDEGVRERG